MPVTGGDADDPGSDRRDEGGRPGLLGGAGEPAVQRLQGHRAAAEGTDQRPVGHADDEQGAAD